MYTDFAAVYDRLMDDVPYAEWARYYAGLLELFSVPKNARCVECACGTGGLTIPLARLGYQMTGMDLSAEMLNRAQQKARAQGFSIPFIRMDMRRLTVQRRVDAVLATCDGVNYLTTAEDVRLFFRRAYEALRPGGVLVFDVSTPYKLGQTLSDRMITASEDDLVYVWQGDFHKSKRLFDIHLDVFIKNEAGLYTRVQESQTQRAHSAEELMGWLAEAGFIGVRLFGDRTMTPPDPEALRWHLAAQKE